MSVVINYGKTAARSIFFLKRKYKIFIQREKNILKVCVYNKLLLSCQLRSLKIVINKSLCATNTKNKFKSQIIF